MRKVIGVVVAVLMCVSMCAGFAFASDGLAGILGDIDVSDYVGGDIEGLVEGLENIDIGGMLIGGKTQEGADALMADIDEIDVEGAVANGVFGILSGLFGSAKAEEAEDILKEDNVALDEALKDLNENNSDEFVNVISGVFESFGLGETLGSLTPGEFDLGAIIDNFLGCAPKGESGTPTDEVASNDFMAGIADTLLGGLQAIGIDTTVIEGLLDNEIVNFFANLYCGWNTGKEDETTEPTTIEITTTEAPTTQAPIHVKTGDTSSVMVAIGTLSVAAAAAFVCMKKKRA